MSYTFHGRTLPEELEESLTAYVETGRPTGEFLEACINNQLRQACNRADDENLWIIPVIAAWLHCEAPMGCHGHADSFDKWIALKYEERQRGKAGVR